MTEDELVIVRDEAYTPEEWARRLRRRAQDRARRHRLMQDPEWRARMAEYQREWHKAHPHYRRDKARQYRHGPALQAKAEAIANARYSLHELSCPYPGDGCDCRVVLVA